jgi:hypothetical protein
LGFRRESDAKLPDPSLRFGISAAVSRPPGASTCFGEPKDDVIGSDACCRFTSR